MGTTTSRSRRNKSFDVSHQAMIETAVRLISENGLEGLSIAAVARESGINRTTVYYHFESRDDLITAVKGWSAQRLAAAFAPDRSQQERMAYINRFVLDNPALIKLWIDDFLSPGDIRDSYPHWDAMIDGMTRQFARMRPDEPFDAEVYAIALLTSAIIAPRVFRNRINPDASTDEIAARFAQEQQRVLKRDSLFIAE